MGKGKLEGELTKRAEEDPKGEETMINMIREKMEHLGSTPSLIGGERKTGKLRKK